MRVRIRMKRPLERTVVIDMGPTSTLCLPLRELKQQVVTHLGLHNMRDAVSLSLNGLDELTGDDVTLADLGIVSGDLILVTLSESYSTAQSNHDSHNTAHSQRPSPQGAHDVNPGQISEAESPSELNHSTTTGADPHAKLDQSGPVSNADRGSQLSADISATSEAAVKGQSETVVENSANVQVSSPPEVNQYLRRVVLISDSVDSEVPASVMSLMERLRPGSVYDALILVLHVLMTESGFSVPGRRAENVPSLPDDWNLPAYHRLQYVYPGLQDVTFELKAVMVGGLVIVYGSISKDPAKFQLKVKVNEHVKLDTTGFVFSKLRKLSRTFKDEISYKLLQTSAKDADLLIPSLSMMFLELKLKILQNLDAQSLLRLSQTCSGFHQLCKTPGLWYDLFRKRYGKHCTSIFGTDPGQDWLQLYKQQYLKALKHQRMFERATLVAPPLMNRPFPLPHAPPGWVPPFGIGGDYDRDPAFHDPFQRIGPNVLRPNFNPVDPSQRGGEARRGLRFGGQGRRKPSPFGGSPMFF